MRRLPETPEFLVDDRLVTAPLWVALVTLPVAVLLGLAVDGWPAAAGAGWGATAVCLNAAAAAWVSARGARTSRGIGIGRVLVALPVRLALLSGAIAVAVGPLGLPTRPVVLAICASQILVIAAQSWLVLRGPSFVGPLEQKGVTG